MIPLFKLQSVLIVTMSEEVLASNNFIPKLDIRENTSPETVNSAM